MQVGGWVWGGGLEMSEVQNFFYSFNGACLLRSWTGEYLMGTCCAAAAHLLHSKCSFLCICKHPTDFILSLHTRWEKRMGSDPCFSVLLCSLFFLSVLPLLSVLLSVFHLCSPLPSTSSLFCPSCSPLFFFSSPFLFSCLFKKVYNL